MQEMVDKFGDLLEQAAESGLPDWSRQYNGLAAVLLLDQFSRQVVLSVLCFPYQTRQALCFYALFPK